MTDKNLGSCLNYFLIVLGILTICSCSKELESPQNILGEYCTYRLGPTGHTTSTIHITQDTTERYDLIISNISGYDNTSEAFKTIGANRINNQIVIPEHNVLIGNSDSMSITGEGSISEEGGIQINISTNTNTNENNFSLYLNNNSSFNFYKAYTGIGQNLSIEANQISLRFTTDENELLDFTIPQSENQKCSLSITRQSLVEQASNEAYLIEADIYFGGNKVFGTLYYSSGSWQNAKSIELALN